MGESRSWLLALLLVLVLLAPVGLLHAAPTLEWDQRLTSIGVSLTPAQDCDSGCWRLTTARYEDVDESGLNHNIYSRLRNQSGQLVEGQPWHVAWPDGDVRITTKAGEEWADFPIFACYNPANGPGPYFAYAGDDPLKSDMVWGMGLPQCQHVNFRLEWQFEVVAPCTACTPRGYLPMVRGP